MNSTQVNHYLRKPGKYFYETQHKLQNKIRVSFASNQFSSRENSRAVKLMGGESVLDVAVVCLSNRIADDDLLEQVYGDKNTKTLTKLVKGLLLLSLSDEFSDLTMGKKKAVYSQKILKCHVRLGLLERESYFTRLAHLLDATLKHDCQIAEPSAAQRCQRRFEATLPLLQVTKEHLDQSRMERVRARVSISEGRRNTKKLGMNNTESTEREALYDQ